MKVKERTKKKLSKKDQTRRDRQEFWRLLSEVDTAFNKLRNIALRTL